MKYYYISYTETFNNRGAVLTIQHPIEWVIREKVARKVSIVINFVMEIDSEDLLTILGHLKEGGIILRDEIRID